MSDEKSQQQTSTESTVAGAAKTGKAISNIAKGAAAGGAHGAAIEAGKSSAKWLIPLLAAVLLPLILVAMLPSIIFGSLLGDGTDSPNGISNDGVLVQNMTAINEGISSILSEGLTDVLERIDSDFASSGCDGKEINNPFGADVVFNANAFVSQYCAHKDTEIASISKEDMEALLTANKDKLYSFAFTDGSAKTFNQHTNVQLDNLYTVLDISELTGELLPVGMFVALDYVWDKAKEDRTKEKAIFIDEAWELIGDDDTNNPNNTKALAGEWVQEIFKIIRGYGGAAIAATQDIGDLDRSRFGKGILNVAKTKIILNLENDEAQRVQHILHLSDAEIMSITRFERGQGLISTNSNHITVSFKASPLEKQLITTDRMELNQILKEKIAQNTHNVVE